MSDLSPVVFVTGTGTDIGKTVTTAALVAGAARRGVRVAVVKPVQTGLPPGAAGDLADVERLAGPVETHELARLPDPLAPDAAARVAGLTLPSVTAHAAALVELAHRPDLDLVLVEGAGGLLVHLDSQGADITDLGLAVAAEGPAVGYVVVAAPGLGTLNHSALTVEALRHRRLECLGFVIGTWPQPPEGPDLAMQCNLVDLPSMTRATLLGVLPDGAGSWSRERFLAAAPDWLTWPL